MLEFGFTPLEFSDGIRRLLGLEYGVEGLVFIAALVRGMERGRRRREGGREGRRGGGFVVLLWLCEVLWVLWCEKDEEGR